MMAYRRHTKVISTDIEPNSSNHPRPSRLTSDVDDGVGLLGPFFGFRVFRAADELASVVASRHARVLVGNVERKLGHAHHASAQQRQERGRISW